MKSITCWNNSGYSLTFTEVFTDGFVLENATGVLEAKADVIRTDNAMGDGSIWNASRMTERNIVLTLRDEPRADHRSNRAKLYRLFPIKTGGTLLYEDGVEQRKISVYCESITADLKNKSHSYTISLIAPDPFFTDPEPTDVTVAAWEAGWEWPAVAAAPEEGLFEFAANDLDTDVLEYGNRTEDLIVTCENLGDVPCGFVLTFTATAGIVRPGLMNVDTGEYISLTSAMDAGETVVIDTRFGHRTAVSIINGAESNIFRFIEAGSTFLQLGLGENHFRATTNKVPTTSANLNVSISFENQYLGA